MKIKSQSCEYYISKLQFKTLNNGKVKKTALKKCLKSVKNIDGKTSIKNSSHYFVYFNDILANSKIAPKKYKLLDEIMTLSVIEPRYKIQQYIAATYPEQNIFWCSSTDLNIWEVKRRDLT